MQLRSSVVRPLALYFVQKYVFITVGSILCLLLLYGINEIIKLTTIEFPASVVLMLLAFAFLSLSSWIKDEDFTQRWFLRWIDIPFGFNLRWMNLYFTPPFVTLVLADKVSAKEAFIIAAIFTVGYLVGFAFIGYLVWGLQIILGTYNHGEEGDGDSSKTGHSSKTEDSLEKGTSTDQTDTRSVHSSHSEHSVQQFELESIDSRQEIGQDNDQQPRSQSRDHLPQQSEFDEGYALSVIGTRRDSHNGSVAELVAVQTHLDEDYVNKITAIFDFVLYGLLTIAGIPVYFCTGYELPIQLGVAIILFKLCLLPPPKIKKYMHPILVSFSISLLVFYIFSLIKHQNFKQMIRHYETGRKYTSLFNGADQWPGAGDFLLSMMDISIASLSLAMYRYRGDLKRYFFALMPVIIVFSFMSFFIYPPLCYHLAVSPSRSLGFTGRSVTMALGMPLVTALGGSTQLMAVTTIMSGIIGVFLGDWITFTLLRVRRHDFVSRGVTLGVNCGAVSTAHLLSVDPRAAAMSSLSFTLFGTLMVVLAAIRPLVKIVRGLVGW